jgi:hypothetical protein
MCVFYRVQSDVFFYTATLPKDFLLVKDARYLIDRALSIFIIVRAGASFDDSGNSRLSDNHFLETPRGTIARSDSIMNHSFTDMVRKNSEHSQGFIGFRKRMAREINHKYCSCKYMALVYLNYVM